MFIKLTGVILIVISTTLMGFKYANIYLDRIEDLKSLKKSLIILNGELKFNKTLLRQALKKMASYKDMRIAQFYDLILKYMDEEKTNNINLAWSMAAKDIADLKKYNFNRNDVEGIIQFGNQIGNTDADSQSAAFEGYISELENEITESIDNRDNKVKVYRTMGIMSGMFVAVLIV